MKNLIYVSLLTVVFIFQSTISSAKVNPDFKKNFFEASYFLYNGDFEDALPFFQYLDSISPNNANIKYLLGVCYFHSATEAKKSIPYLEEAVLHVTKDYKEGYFKEENTPLSAYWDLGNAYHKLYKFDKAVIAYQKYETLIDTTNVEAVKELEYKIQVAKNANELMNVPVEMTVQNLGKEINSKYPEYKPILTADESTIIYTSRRDNSTGYAISEDGKFFEDLYISENINGNWTAPKSMGTNINTADHEAGVGLSADGQTLLIYKFLEGSGDIYISNLEGDTWSVPSKIGSDINLKSWESHASLSADGEILFFTSDREGGFGGRDIYMMKKLPTGDWSLAQNMGPSINTEYDEESPFLHPDGITFYFSSKGHKTMGGFDVMFTEKTTDGKWGEVHNIGYPVNTTGDDVFYIPTTDGKGAYYSSFRKDGFGDQDIYKIYFPKAIEKSLTVYKGIVRTKSGKVPDVIIEVTDVETGELIGNYTPNSATGKYLIILQPGRTYDITYDGEGCFFYSDKVTVTEESAYSVINQAIDLDPLEVGQIVELENIFFDYDKATLRDASLTQLDNLYKLMAGCPTLSIEIEGHTDAKGDDAYNLKLSQERAEEVTKYLTEKGIAKERLQARGFGETLPVAPNTNADGTDNPDGRAKNRRTEMKIISVN